MGFDAVHEMDSLEAAIKDIAGDAIEVHLNRNTIGDSLYGCADEEDDLVAYHHLWVIFPAREDYPMHIAIAYLKEYRSKRAAKIDLAFKWVSEDNGPAALDCPVEWLDRVPEPVPVIGNGRHYGGGFTWREMVSMASEWGPRLSKAQRTLLDAVREGGKYVKGGQVATARSMAASELVTMRDDGPTGRFGTKWWVELTPRGKKELRKWRCPGCGMLADEPVFTHGDECGACADNLAVSGIN